MDYETKTKKPGGLRFADILSGVVIFLFLVCFAVTFTLNFRPLYYLDMKLLDISGQSGYSDEVIRESFDTLITYNNVWYHGSLNFAWLTMSENARIHFEQVKAVFSIFEYGLLPLLVLSVLIIAVMGRKGRSTYLAAAGAVSVGIPAVPGTLIAVNWEWIFVKFHQIVFNNDYWLFDPEKDPIILMLPDEYFMHCAILIMGIIIAGSAVCLGVWKLKK